jgi:hypothetical protein
MATLVIALVPIAVFFFKHRVVSLVMPRVMDSITRLRMSMMRLETSIH